MCPPVWRNNGCGTRISSMKGILTPLKRLWRSVRTLSGEDAYDRYLAHWHEHHGDEGAPLDRKAFFKQHQEHKWNGINRCC